MKKLFVFVVLAVFAMSFTTPNVSDKQAPVPAYWEFTIKWDPSGCTSCGTITSKEITYYIINTENNNCIVDSKVDHTVTGTEYSNSGNNQCFDVDCENCYSVQATITYFDSSGECCSKTEYTTWSGTELNNGTAELLIEM